MVDCHHNNHDDNEIQNYFEVHYVTTCLVIVTGFCQIPINGINLNSSSILTLNSYHSVVYESPIFQFHALKKHLNPTNKI
ncbi:hypothetical protein KSF78_0009016 [Schistosoma japonicum]|nr:hypothetical protein KSF78_0009016 [Schistosoma japonicum]